MHSFPLGVGLLALAALVAPAAGAATLVAPAPNAVIKGPTTTYTWTLAPDEQNLQFIDANYTDIFIADPFVAGAFSINERTGQDIWAFVPEAVPVTGTTLTSENLYAGPHTWGVVTGVGTNVATASAPQSFTVKTAVKVKDLKLDVSRTRSTASLDWSVYTNLHRFSIKWTLFKDGSALRGDTDTYRARPTSLYKFIHFDDYVGVRRGFFTSGSKLKLTVQVKSLSPGVSYKKTFTKSITA